jgi:hypothetical protein
MSTYAPCKLLTEASSLSIGEVGYTLHQRFRIDNISTDTDFIAMAASAGQLEFALNLPVQMGRAAIPARGDRLVVVTGPGLDDTSNLFCTGKSARHPTISKDSVEVDIVAQELGVGVDIEGQINGTSSTYMWLVGGSFSGSTVSTRTSIGPGTVGTASGFGQLFQVFYRPGTPGFDYQNYTATTHTHTDLASGIINGEVIADYAEVPSLEPLDTIIYRMRMIFDPTDSDPFKSLQDLMRYYDGAMNSVPIWGCAPYTLRLRMTAGEFDALKSLRLELPGGGGTRAILYDVNLFFEYRARGWKEIGLLTIPATGRAPPDVDSPITDLLSASPKGHGNGWGQFATLVARDFSGLGLPDLRMLTF